MPEYYNVDENLLEMLKICIEDKEMDPSQIENVSKQLRGGMNRNKFQTNYTGPKD